MNQNLLQKRAFRAALVTLLLCVAGVTNLKAQVPQGAINGLFTINSSGSRVYFSQGNLQYIGSAAAPYWKFADHQWDYLGTTTNQNSSNSNVDRDLFGWGTSGINHGANCYQPWSTSTNDADYYAYGSESYNLNDLTGLADWGCNAISNGGNQENSGWRTLTQAEWYYVFITRSTVSGIRYAKAQVNGVSGVMLFPDLWNSSFYQPNNYNSGGADFSTNVLTSAQWERLEQQGAVFLPAAGYRYGTSVTNVDPYGYYWSASYCSSLYAYFVYFYGSGLYAGNLNNRDRDCGHSVRLVCPAQNSILGIKATPNPALGGVVSGAGAYAEGAECTLTAMPNAGFEFINWVENGEIVSTVASLTFTVNAERWLVARFKKANSIVFADMNVEAICLDNWDSDGDGLLSYEEAAAVTDLGTVFKSNTAITSFDELQYFTGLNNIAAQAFFGCNHLQSVVFPESITYIGQKAFQNCTSLTGELVFPNTLVTVEDNAFLGCTNIAAVTIGPGVTQIDAYAFGGCTGINVIKTLAVMPPSLANNSFYNVSTDVALYVPCEARNAYHANENWNVFTNYQDSPYELAVLSEDNAQGAVNIEKHATCDDMVCIVKANPNLHYGFSCWLKDGEVVSTERVYTFTLEENMTLVARFEPNETLSNHWVPLANFENNMTGIGVVLIDGVEQLSYRLELGIFCGDECRGSSLPEQWGERWLYPFTMGGVAGETFTFRLFNHETNQEMELFCNTTVAYQNDADIGNLDDPFTIEFSNNVTVSAVVNPTGAGNVTGVGEYPWGSTAELTATANPGYAFRNWTRYGSVLSTDPTITITVEGPVTLTANFDIVQQWELQEGWTWWSSYIELSNINGLALLEESLGDAGEMIKNQQSFVKKEPNTPWYGSLTSLNNENGYKIKVTSPCTPSIAGTVASPSNHIISLQNGYNWIGYPVNTEQLVSTALSNFEPQNEDIIKGQNGHAKYNASNSVWFPQTFKLVPGCSYMYKSNANETRTLVFVQGRNAEVTLPQEVHYWESDAKAFPDNSTIQAVVVVDGKELRDDAVEVGAFVGGVCRGSSPLLYDEYHDRYYAMLTVTGEEGDELCFGMVDTKTGEVNMNSDTKLNFVVDAVEGGFSSPFEIHFASQPMQQTSVMAFPNPLEKNQEFILQIPAYETVKEVWVNNAIGVTLRNESGKMVNAQLEGFPEPGVYVVRALCESGAVYYCKLIVK